MSKEGLLITKNVYWNMMEAYARFDIREKVVEMYQAARNELMHPYISMIRYPNMREHKEGTLTSGTLYGLWGEADKATIVFEQMKDDLHTTGFAPGVITYLLYLFRVLKYFYLIYI